MRMEPIETERYGASQSELCTLEEVVEHEEDGGEPVERGQGARQAFIITGQTAERACQAKVRSTTQRRGMSTKPRLLPRA